MDAQEFAFVVATTPTDALVEFVHSDVIPAIASIRDLSDDDYVSPEQVMSMEVAPLLHYELVVRHRFVDALDLFATANSVAPVIGDMSYTDYVDDILRTIGDSRIGD
jgi:hypothetical protein